MEKNYPATRRSGSRVIRRARPSPPCQVPKKWSAAPAATVACWRVKTGERRARARGDETDLVGASPLDGPRGEVGRRGGGRRSVAARARPDWCAVAGRRGRAPSPRPPPPRCRGGAPRRDARDGRRERRCRADRRRAGHSRQGATEPRSRISLSGDWRPGPTGGASASTSKMG